MTFTVVKPFSIHRHAMAFPVGTVVTVQKISNGWVYFDTGSVVKEQEFFACCSSNT